MTPKITKKKKRRSLNLTSFKVRHPNTVESLYDEYKASGIGSMKYSIFEKDRNDRNIWNEKMWTSKFLYKCLGCKWLKKLYREEKALVVKIFDRFIADYKNSDDFLWLIRGLTFPELVGACSNIGKKFGFEPEFNEKLGINFNGKWKTSDIFVTFEAILNLVIDASLRIVTTLKLKHIRRSKFLVPMLFKLALLYIRCLIDSIRKIYKCKVKEDFIVRWKSRYAETFLPLWMVPDFVPREIEVEALVFEAPVNGSIEIESPEIESPEIEEPEIGIIENEEPGVEVMEFEAPDYLQKIPHVVSQTQKWTEEFLEFSGRIKVKKLRRNPQKPCWFSQILASQSDSDLSDLFDSSFPNHDSYDLPEPAMKYLRKIHQKSTRNLKCLIKNGEFQTITRNYLSGCKKNTAHDVIQQEEWNALLGELMTVVLQRVLDIEGHQLLPSYLEEYVRRITCSREFVFYKEDADLVANFDTQFEGHLACLLEDCVHFDRSMVFLKCAIVRYMTLIAVHVVRNAVDVKLIRKEMKSFVYDGTFEFEKRKQPSSILKETELLPNNVQGEIGDTMEKEVSPIRVAPNRLKWVYDETSFSWTSSKSSELEVSTQTQRDKAVNNREEDVLIKVGPQRWKWVEPEGSQNSPVSKPSTSAPTPRQYLKKAEKDKNVSERMVKFLKELVEENETLKELLSDIDDTKF